MLHASSPSGPLWGVIRLLVISATVTLLNFTRPCLRNRREFTCFPTRAFFRAKEKECFPEASASYGECVSFGDSTTKHRVDKMAKGFDKVTTCNVLSDGQNYWLPVLLHKFEKG